MPDRYYWERKTFDAMPQTAELIGDEAHHLTKVMRQKVGDEITLFDGHGHEFLAQICTVRKDGVSLNILKAWEADTEQQRRLTLAVSLPKGDRQKWLIEKLTELGCHQLIPLATERGVIQTSPPVIDRLQRQTLEATKQCGRSTLMQIAQEKSILETISQFQQEHGEQGIVYIAHPIADTEVGQIKITDILKNSPTAQNLLVLIGPVGGLSPAEVQTAIDCGAIPLDLGKRILRVETAAIVCSISVSLLSPVS